MKKYTDKELHAMSPEEAQELQNKALEEFNCLGKQLEELLEKKTTHKDDAGDI